MFLLLQKTTQKENKESIIQTLGDKCLLYTTKKKWHFGIELRYVEIEAEEKIGRA